MTSIQAPAPEPLPEPVPQTANLPPRELLRKKQRDLLVPVTFRMPQRLKEKLEHIARLHEVNQTDLINEAIDLNLQRYASQAT